MNKKPFIPAWLFEQSFSAQQFAIYCYVAMRGECFICKSKMIAALRMHPQTFWKNLNALIKAGWITKSYRGQGRAVTLRCQLEGADISTKPKRKAQTRHDREAHNMIMMDNLREMFRHNGLSDDEGADTNVA